MMLNLQNTEALVTAIMLVFAYSVAITLIGAGQAYITYILGDPTAKDAGLTSLNPLAHVDPLGALCFIFFSFGWSKQCPIVTENFTGDWHALKAFIAFFARVLLSIVIAFFSLILFIGLLGTRALSFAFSLFVSDNVPLALIKSLYPATSSFIIVGALFLVALVFYSVLFATLDTIRQGVRYIVCGGHMRYGSSDDEMLVMLFSLVLMIIAAPMVTSFLLNMLTSAVRIVGCF